MTMKKMKKVLACTMAAAMAAALTACGGSGDSETPAAASSESKSEAAEAKTEEAKSEASGDKVTVTFWDENAGDQRTEFYMEIIEKFEEENPDIVPLSAVTSCRLFPNTRQQSQPVKHLT